MGINKYYGGKNRYASKIVSIIDNYSNGCKTYIEPFCGWGSVLSLVVDKNIFEQHIASDANDSVVLFLRETSQGLFVPPKDVSEETFETLKCEKTPSALQAFVGICYSFEGIWFKKYSLKYDPKHFADRDQFPEKLMKRITKLKDVEFKCAKYQERVLGVCAEVVRKKHGRCERIRSAR